MILHLVTKHRVTNSCLSVFEKRAPGQNIILVLYAMPDSVATVNNGIEVSEENEKRVVDSLDFSKISHVVMHYLTRRAARFVQKYVPEGIPIYWWTYGGDLYQPYLEPRGCNLFYTDLTPCRIGWVYMYYRFFETYKQRILFRLGFLRGDRYMQTELLNRIKGIIPCIPPDYEMACRYLKKNFKKVRVHPIGIRSHYDNEFYNGNCVAIGHSASYSDNHLYALKYLSNIDIKNSIISLTLSYNVNSNKYVEMVKKRYKDRFKEKVSFVEELLSKEDWCKTQEELGTLILPTWRQEALASVYSSFLRGVKLFLSKKGPMYQFFLDYGFKVFAIEDMNQNLFDTPLTEDEKHHNRNQLIRFVNEGQKHIDEDFEVFFGDEIEIDK